MNILPSILLFMLLFLLPSSFAAIDLQITPSNITFSSLAPIEGETILINATFSNAGNQSADNVLVTFFDDSSLFENATVSVPAFSSVAVSKTWKTEIGPHNLKVALDQDNNISEVNESNNQASKNISIGGYHIYYGKARAITALGIGFDSLFETENAGCDILVADTDSNVDFSSLQALGRRESGIPALNDFIDLDTVLNMTLFEDSIVEQWTRFGDTPLPAFKFIPQEISSFMVFNQLIPNVPIINSTNTTTFRTGILWDTSDNTQALNRQFDAIDREDLIFVTKINQSKTGSFGVYDYEIKIPALLRDYRPGSSTVDFFLDMDTSCS